jgi:uncharacterized repeat protein (TIGR01451 family)
MKRKWTMYSAAVLAIACLASECTAQTADHRAPAAAIASSGNAPSPAAKHKVAEEYGKLPLSFEANEGQTDPQVKFLSRGAGYELFLLPREAVVILQKGRHAVPAKKIGPFRDFPEAPKEEAGPVEIIRMSLLGAAANAEITGIEQMPGKSNYFVGNDPSQWRTNVPNYAKVHYQRVYPGIDLVYHGSHQQLEYDFVVAPGADPRQIRLGLKGAKKLELTPEGDLLLTTSGEPVRLRKPVIYQESGGQQQPVDGSFVLAAKGTVKFRIGKYDARQPLIIDPVLAYSTYLGGNGMDQGNGIAVDASGAYVTGSTTSTDFFTPNAFQTTLSNCGSPAALTPCTTAFVAKLSPAGNVLLYATYLGGNAFTQGDGIAVFSGNAYVLGETSATNFPTTAGAFQTTLKGAQNSFVTQLNAAGSALMFSTYLGGSGLESSSNLGFGGNTIAVDAAGNAYVTGSTTSGDFPTVNALPSSAPGGGAFKSTDTAATWTAIPAASGLTDRNISALAVDPKNSTNVYAGTINGGIFKSTDGGTTWVAMNSGLGPVSIRALVIDPTIAAGLPATLYVGAGLNGAFKSVDGAASWTAINSGLVITGTTTVAAVRALAIDPNAPGTLYAGGADGLFKTTNGGTGWVQGTGFPAGETVQELAIDPLHPATLYAATTGGVFKSGDGGTTWTAINTGLTLPPPNSTVARSVRSLVVDPITTTNLYAVAGGQVFKSTDGGNTWNTASTGLTDGVSDIILDPALPSTLFVGSSSTGVFTSTDSAGTWTTATNALSNFNVDTLAIGPTTPATLYAGSSVNKAFVTKFSSAGAVAYATYLGGSSMEFSGGIAADNQGNAYVTGTTRSRNFPTANAFQATRQSGFDAFVTKLNASGTSLVYSTYLDGTGGFSEGFGIAVDSSGAAYVTGDTGAANFPTTTGVFQTAIGGTDTAFVTKFNSGGNTLAYSTFLGGSSFDVASAIAVDGLGDAWVTGFTDSPNFPVVNPIRASSTGNCFGSAFACQSIFITELNPAATALLFSTYFGPVNFSSLLGGIALDAPVTGGNQNAYVTGSTLSADLPLVNPVSATPPANASAGKVFVMKIGNTTASADLSITLGHSPDPVVLNGNLTFTATVTNNDAAGGTTATGVTLYPTIVSGATNLPIALFTSATPSQGTCDISTGFCALSSLAPGATATITLVTTPTQGGTFTAGFGVGGNESDPNPANNVATTTVNVLGGVSVSLAGTASPAPVVLGGNLAYQFLVNNGGPSPATGVTLTDTLPAGVTLVSATFVTPTVSVGTCTGTAPVVCSLGNLAVNGTATVTIVVKPPAVGTVTNSSTVTTNETNSSNKTTLQQVSDVVASPNPNNARLNGHYALLFNGATASALMAFVGSFVADGNGNLTSGTFDINQSSGVVANQAFTGTYNVGADNRGTLTITFLSATGAPTALTFRFALGLLNSQGVATKARFIEFDTSGQTGAGVIEMQDPAALANASNATLNGSFAFGASGEDISHNHFAAAGRFTADGAGNITSGLEDADTAGILSTALTFTGTYNLPAGSQNGRGTFIDTFSGISAQIIHGAFYVVSANELFTISTDPRSTGVLSSGQVLKQQTTTFSNAWLNGTSVFNASGVVTSTGTDVIVGLATTNGAGNIATLSDENNGGVLSLDKTGSATNYSVAASGRTTFSGGSGTNPVLYLVGLNKGFLVSTGTEAAVGSFEPQSGGPFSNASVSGNFFLGDLTPDALTVNPVNGVSSADGVGNVVSTEDGTSAGTLIADAVFTDTYLVSPNGRMVLGKGDVLWLVSPTKAFSIRAKNGKNNDVVAAIEGAALPSADLGITKSASVTTVAVGTQFAYTLTVTNNGPNSATGVVVTDPLPAGVTFVSASASQGACSGPAQVICSLGAIANGASVTISISVTAATAGSVTNTANVAANEPDPNLTNNTASVTVTITGGTTCGTNQWTGKAADGLWTTPSNWSSGVVPISTDAVCIDPTFAGSTITVGGLAAANQTIASLNSNATISFTSGPLTVTGAATFVNVLNVSGGTLTLNGASTVQGATNLSGGTLSGGGNVTLTGSLTWTGGTMSGAGVINANGGMNIPSGQPFLDTRTLNVSGATTFGSSTTSASLVMQNGAVINNLAGATWSIVNGNGSAIFLNGATTGTFNNAGTFQMTGGISDTVSVTFNNTGTVNANSGTLAFTGVFNENSSSTTRANGGKISSSTAINLGQAADVTLLGVDPANPPAIVADISNPGARIIPGSFNTPGILSTSGLYSQGASGTFEVNITGTAVGTGYSQLNVGKTATLGGQLFVALLNGFTPAAGNNFTVMTCAGTSPCISGTFANITSFPALPTGLAWNIAYNATNVVLSVGSTVLPATHFSVSAPTAATQTTPFNFTVTALDQSNNTVTGYSGTVHFTSSDGNAQLPVDSKLTNGVGTFSATLNGIGSQTLTATDTATSSITGTSNAITVSATGTFVLTVTVTGTGTGTVSSQAGLAPTISCTTGSTAGCTANYNSGQIVTLTAAAGANSTFAGWSQACTNTTGTCTVTMNQPQNVTATFNPSVAPATHFAVTAPATTTAGTLFSFTVTAQDASNNTVTGYSGAVHFTSSDAQAVLPVNTTLSSGTGTFQAALKTLGSQTITATDTVNATITGTSNAITVAVVVPPVLQSIAVTPNPASVAAGNTLQFTAAGTFSDSSTQNITTSVTWNSSNSAAATISNAAGSQGLATAGNTAGAATTITAALGGVTSPGITLTVGASDIRAALVAFPDSGIAPATVTWNPAFPDSNYTAVCTVETTPSDFLLPVITLRTPTSMTVIPTDGGATPGVIDCIAIPDSDTSDIRHSRVAFRSSPATVAVSWSPAFADTNYTVACTLETQGATNGGFTSVISALSPSSISVDGGGIAAGTMHCIAVPDTDAGTLRHGRTALATNSPPTVAVNWNNAFADTNYAAACSDEQLDITSSGAAIAINAGSKLASSVTAINEIPSGTVHCISAPAPPATHFAVVASATATAGTAFNFTVTALDALNNTATGYNGTVQFTSSDATAVLPANSTLTNGTGTLAATLKTTGPQTITATDTVTASIAGSTGAITVSAGAATHFAVVAQATATAGTAINFTVTAQDQFNNTATGYTGAAHFTSTDSQAVLPANSTLTNGTGTFPATLGTPGSQTITATDTVNAKIAGTSNVITVSAGLPVVTLSAASLSFASQPVGTPSATQGVTLTNSSSTLPLAALSMVAGGDFTQTNNCGTSLAALSSCSILVTFTPTVASTRTGAITISDNGVGSPQSVSLTGIGINAPAITLLPGSLVFSSQLVGVSSPPLTISMSNSGNATLNIASIAITGSNAGDFSQTSTCGQTLAPSISCVISVVFKPTSGGQRTAGVAITSDARGSVPVVTLSGTGLSAGLELSSALLVFDNQTIGSTSAPQTVILSNGGATAVAITSVTASGDFAQTNNCGNSVAASSNCAIRVTFTPTATATRTGSISIVTGGSSTPLTVNLTGAGVVVTLSLAPASLTFNDQKVGTSSQAQSVALTNTGGAGLTINSIVPSGDFLEADSCGTSLAAGAGCSINVTFLPTATGTRTGTITVTSNAQGSPHTIKLTGNGISRGPAVGLTCTSGGPAASACTGLTFAAQAVGTTSGAQAVALTNVGNDTLNITSIAASGDFTASNSCGVTLAASASCAISVTFTPTTTGTRSGSLVIKDNTGDSPQSISLTGTGTPSGPAASISATALPFGSQMVGTTSNTQLVTVTNPGNATLTFLSIRASGDFSETDTCANGVAPNASCTLSVSFTPTAAGPRAGAITISDNAPGSPQSVTLSGQGTDIVISVPGGSTSATVSAGQTATFSLSLTPSGGFSGPVTVSCNSAIPASTCSSAPSSFSLDAPVTVMTTVTTSAPSHSTVLPIPRLSPRNFAPPRAMTQILLLLVAFLAFFIAALRRRRAWIGVTACLFLVALVSGCAGGSASPGISGPTAGTPSNAYTVAVVVQTASGATRSVSLTVIVH